MRCVLSGTISTSGKNLNKPNEGCRAALVLLFPIPICRSVLHRCITHVIASLKGAWRAALTDQTAVSVRLPRRLCSLAMTTVVGHSSTNWRLKSPGGVLHRGICMIDAVWESLDSMGQDDTFAFVGYASGFSASSIFTYFCASRSPVPGGTMAVSAS